MRYTSLLGAYDLFAHRNKKINVENQNEKLHESLTNRLELSTIYRCKNYQKVLSVGTKYCPFRL